MAQSWREYGDLLIRSHLARQSYYKRRGKFWWDRFVALAGLLVLSPVFAVVAAMVRWRLGSPVLFTQQRIGAEQSRFAWSSSAP